MPKAKPITAKQIDAILSFLEIFETPGFSCGEWPRLESDQPNHFVMPMFDYTPAVCSFVEYLNEHGWIEPFDWGDWTDTAAQYVDSPDLLIAADTDTIRKLLTTHVRQDRFCEGHLAAMFENGHIVAILRRLKEIRHSMEPMPKTNSGHSSQATLFPIEDATHLEDRSGMMGNGSYRLPSGREVYISRFYLDHTFSGQLEGTPETLSPSILKRMPEDVQSLMPPGKPLVVIEPQSMPLPPFRLVAELESRKGVTSDDPDFNSQLFVCWFTTSVSGSIDDLLEPVLKTIDWEAHAEDYNIMDF